MCACSIRPAAAREIGQRMRLFVSGSAPLPAQVLEDFRKLFGHTILERYGMTETLMNISNPYDGERRPGSVGLPAARDHRARGRRAKAATFPMAKPARCISKAPTFSPATGAATMPRAPRSMDGWFKTGDLCIRSADGYYTLCGRRSDLIISGGFNIYPREIEEFLMEQPGIAEAAVAGEAHPRARRSARGLSWCASEHDRYRRARSRLPRETRLLQNPAPFQIVDKLPRNALGKVQKHLLPKAAA